MAALCKKGIADAAYETVASRPSLEKIKEQLGAGGTLVVWRLDPHGRSLRDLIGWMTWLEEQKVGLLNLQKSIDADTTSGKLTFHPFKALAVLRQDIGLKHYRNLRGNY